jgi:hypothetical protein
VVRWQKAYRRRLEQEEQMTQTGYRGVVRGGVVLLDKNSPLAEGTEVVVTPVAGVLGSPAAILAAMENSPKVPSEWVDELEHLIAEGRRPAAPPVSFLGEPGSQENP